jgi:hypothetical protein
MGSFESAACSKIHKGDFEKRRKRKIHPRTHCRMIGDRVFKATGFTPPISLGNIEESSHCFFRVTPKCALQKPVHNDSRSRPGSEPALGTKNDQGGDVTVPLPGMRLSSPSKRPRHPHDQRDDDHGRRDADDTGCRNAESPALEFQMMFRHDAVLH